MPVWVGAQAVTSTMQRTPPKLRAAFRDHRRTLFLPPTHENHVVAGTAVAVMHKGRGSAASQPIERAPATTDKTDGHNGSASGGVSLSGEPGRAVSSYGPAPGGGAGTVGNCATSGS
ncbi:hypothetical protein GCM10027280_01780 [Micromonospora polyrhachis]